MFGIVLHGFLLRFNVLDGLSLRADNFGIEAPLSWSFDETRESYVCESECSVSNGHTVGADFSISYLVGCFLVGKLVLHV